MRRQRTFFDVRRVRRSAAVTLLTAVLVACAPGVATPRPTPGTPGSSQSAPHHSCRANDAVVTINDPAVFDAVASQAFGANVDATELRCSDLARVTRLNVTGARSLAGLEYAVNLSQLTVRNSGVSSLAPVEGLARLTTLNVTGSSLTTLHSLPALPALVALDISTNLVSDLTPLANVPGLTYLKANGNAISDISGLEDLRELVWVDLSDNPITDITALSGHEHLETLLLNDNFISDAGPLSGAARLQRLSLANNRLANVDFIKGLELRTVDLSGNNITSVRGVAENRYIDGSRSVDLRGNCIDLTSEDPLTQDVVATGGGVQLEPQREDCSFEALGS